jgi:hypothetical protein
MLNQRLEEERAARAGLEAVLCNVRSTVLSVGPGMRLQFANPAGETLLRRGDGLLVRAGNITTLRPLDAEKLQGAIATAARKTRTVPEPISTATLVIITRRDELPPYRAVVFPLVSESAIRTVTPTANVVLFVDDPEIARETTPAAQDVFRRAFLLTPAEARLAVLLTSGETFAIM